MAENDEKKGAAGWKAWSKKFWWAPFAVVFVFLLSGGYIAMVSMRQSAQKLAGGDNFDQLAANSAVYEGKVASNPNDTFGVSSGETAQEGVQGQPSPIASSLMPQLMGKGRVKGGADGASVPMGAEAGGGQAEASPGQGLAASGAGSGTMAARMQSMGGKFGKPIGGAAQGAARSIGFRADGSVAGVTGMTNSISGAGQAKAAKAGVMDTLKGAFRASVYGARTASQDSAKNWSARVFDATPGANTTLEYSDEMKKELDSVNPNSIPGFLRDQDISAEGAGKMGASAVSAPGLDKDAMKAAADRSKAEDPNAEMAASLFGGMMNAMFKGLGPTTTPNTPPAGANTGAGGDNGEGMSLLSDPKSDNSDCKAGCTDEFGYVSYGPPGGFQTVFGSDGKQVGCTDNAAGFSIPYGAPGCP